MELKIFNYIEEAITILEKQQPYLEEASDLLSLFFEDILKTKEEGYVNVTSRVKSSLSLKEKIIRNSYYKKYSVDELFNKLSDLIGIRIECRFIDDENEIYKELKKHFNKQTSDGLYYNASTPKVKMMLAGKQPQEQKNGFKIFRIDGIYDHNGMSINFELQIKSLVNMFWGEIEHKIIYKNYSYMAANNLISSVMTSIKNNLTMLDNQLNMMYNQINEMNSVNTSTRMFQTEMLISKLIFDIYSTRMKDNIGFIVDFRKTCDIIMKYIFRSNNAENLDDYNNTLLKTFVRLNEISKNEMVFDVEIYFERDPKFGDEFSRTVGTTILRCINNDFQWNLFFRMLFEIELGNNAEDFETFVKFLKNRFIESPAIRGLYSELTFNEAEDISSSIINTVSKTFERVASIQFLYDYNLDAINSVIQDFIDNLLDEPDDYIDWSSSKNIYLKILQLKLLSIFDYDVETREVTEVIRSVKSSNCKYEVSKRLLKYEEKLDGQEHIKAEEAVRFFKLK